MSRIHYVALVALMLGGCTVGPDFRPPAPPASLGYPLASTPGSGAGAAGSPVIVGAKVPERWWEQFANPDLDALIEEALRRNNEIAAAEASLRQYGALADVAGAARLPSIDAGVQGEKTRTSRSLSGVLADDKRYNYTLSTAQLSISYPLDVFGGLARRLESARATAEVQAHRLDAARLTIASSTALAAIRLAGIHDQLAAARRAIAFRRAFLAAFLRRHTLGDVGAAEIEAQRAALSRAEAVLPPLIKAEAHERAGIDVLLGREPGSAPIPPIALDALRLPPSMPLTLPADLVAQRPDVRAAEAQMHAASADVGVAVAARLPSITLTGNLGGRAIEFGRMFSGGNLFSTLVGGIAQPIVRGGALRRQQASAEAALDGARAQYRGVVLAALTNVSDALVALREDREALRAADEGNAAAERNRMMVTRQVELGASGSLEALNAASAAAEAQLRIVDARVTQLSDTVGLFQALGGGWRERNSPPAGS